MQFQIFSSREDLIALVFDGSQVSGGYDSDYRLGLSNKEAVAKIVTAELINILKNLHAIEPNSIGLENLGRSGNYFARTASGWFKRAEVAWQDEMPKEVSQIKSWLMLGNAALKSNNTIAPLLERNEIF